MLDFLDYLFTIIVFGSLVTAGVVLESKKPLWLYALLLLIGMLGGIASDVVEDKKLVQEIGEGKKGIELDETIISGSDTTYTYQLVKIRD